MGSPKGEAGRNPDERLHQVEIPGPLALGETELTVGQFRRFVEATGYRTEVDRSSTCLRPDKDWQQLVPDMTLTWESPGFAVSADHPVACIGWNDAIAYAQWLSGQTGHRYRLPTEAEWEYAARAGSGSSRFWGDDPKAGCRLANSAECKDEHTYAAPVGTYPANGFGLREMLGNLAEWTCSDYSKTYGGPELACADPGATGGDSPRVLRGGSWLDAPALVRSAARDAAPPNLGLSTVGLRLVREPDAGAARDDRRHGKMVER
jgi:formylglycine-generating enzyme required for sulfatase activity